MLNRAGSAIISRHAYTYDNVGNLTHLSETLAQVGGGTATNNVTYSYDQLSRLTGDGTRTYGYDPVGNRLSLTQNGTTSYTYDKADRILSVGGQTYTVDASGNLTSFPSNTLAYDQANRLKSATISGTTTTYAYDGDGQRASKTVGTTTTSYVYDASGALPNVLTDGSRKYVYGLGLAYTTDTAGNVQAVYHADGLGSVRALTDASGNLIQTYETDPFGVPTQTQGASTQPFGYTGQQQDAESSFVFLRARYYDPAIGRFLGRDPFFGSVARPPTLNRFSYVQNNPLLLGDPSGLSSDILADSCGPSGANLAPSSSRSSPDFQSICSNPMSLISWMCGDNVVQLYPVGTLRMTPFDRDLASAIDGMLEGDATQYATGESGSGGSSSNYRETFLQAHPELRGKVWVHHAVEQQVLTRYPGRFTEEEINSLDNLRGVPLDVNGTVHLSEIRMEWNAFYKANPNATRAEILQEAATIDSRYSATFVPR